MKKPELGQTVAVLANLGVIAGIVFLAVELRQNNDLMRAAARDAQNIRVQNYTEQVYVVPGLAEIILKAHSGEPLTEAENLKLLTRQRRRILGMQAQLREYRQGTVETINLAGWRAWFYEGDFFNPRQIDTWDEIKLSMDADFVEYVEENILNR